LSKLNEELASKGFVVLAVNPGIDSEKEIQDYWKQAKLSYDTISTKPDDPATQKFGVTGFPTNFLVGKDGKVLWRGLLIDEETLRAEIKSAGIGG
jgi:redoxin